MKIAASKPFIFKTSLNSDEPPSVGETGEVLTKAWHANTLGADTKEWSGFVRGSGQSVFVVWRDVFEGKTFTTSY